MCWGDEHQCLGSTRQKDAAVGYGGCSYIDGDGNLEALV